MMLLSMTLCDLKSYFSYIKPQLIPYLGKCCSKSHGLFRAVIDIAVSRDGVVCPPITHITARRVEYV